MCYLIAGLVIFFGVHLIPSLPRLRAGLVARAGATLYKAGFAAVALGGVGLMIFGMGRADTIILWQPPAWTMSVPALVMAPALILLAAANFPNNIRRFARHPMSAGVLLWSASHLITNGDLAATLLFGGFALFALFDMRTATAAEAMPPAPIKQDALAVGIGLAAYFVLVTFHDALFGAPGFS